jgi:hypothetical protein
MPYKRRRVQAPHNGKINLYALVHFPHLFVSKSGHFWSTARKGLRQRKVNKFRGILFLRVSSKGYVANFTAESLGVMARLHDWRVHWDGSRICQGWLPDELDTVGEGKSVDTAPRT